MPVRPPVDPSEPQLLIDPLLVCRPFWIYLRVMDDSLPPLAWNCVTTVKRFDVSIVWPGPQKLRCPLWYGLNAHPPLSQLLPLHGWPVIAVALALASSMSISLQQ